MDKNEIMNRFDKMLASAEQKHTEAFKDVMRCMLQYMTEWNIEAAEEYVNKLEAMEWNNFLTEKEAVSIVNNMVPTGCWDISNWEKLADTTGVSKEEYPYYNKYALYVVMNMIYSDDWSTILKIVDKTAQEVSDEEMFKSIHLLALNKLKDKDNVFNIRKYFSV